MMNIFEHQMKFLSGHKSSHGGGGSMVSFDHLELPTDRAPSETFRDMPRALDDLPGDVFDAIPRAVTAREEKRLEQYHKKLERDRALRTAQKESRRETEQVSHVQGEANLLCLGTQKITTALAQ